jgi:NADP-dependent 3-hydroxy acid dehydrogenase YdfG
MSGFEGKVIAISGGASGIGLCTARLLASRGAKVSIADVQEDLLKAAVQRIEEAGGDVIAVQTNVTDRRQVEKWIEETVSRYGDLMMLQTLPELLGRPLVLRRSRTPTTAIGTSFSV